MKIKLLVTLSLVILIFGIVVRGQEKAAIEVDHAGPFNGGDPISFVVSLDAPLPQESYLSLRIAPVDGNEEINLGGGEVTDASRQKVRITGKLPETILSGKWRVSTIWFYLPGANGSNTRISSNDLRFEVEAKPFKIPNKAQVTVGR